MEQDTDKTKKKRKKRNTIRNLLQATAKRIKITKGQSTPPPLRKREKTRPDIIVESGDLVRLTEEHIHGLPEEDATDYLAIKVTEAGDGAAIMTPQQGDTILQVYCDCENPNIEDMDRCGIAIVPGNKQQDQTVIDSMKRAQYRPVNQRALTLYHPDDEVEKKETEPDLLLSIPSDIDKTKMNDPTVKTRMQAWMVYGQKIPQEGEAEEDLEQMIADWMNHTTQETKAILFRLHSEKFQGATNVINSFKKFTSKFTIAKRDRDIVDFNMSRVIEKNTKAGGEDYVGIVLEPRGSSTRAILLKESQIEYLEREYDERDSTIKFDVPKEYGIPARCSITYKPKTRMMNYLKTPEVVKGYEEFMLPRITFLQMEHEILAGEGVEDQLKAKEDLKITINLMRTLNMNKQDYETYKNENLKNEKTEGENEGGSYTATAPKKEDLDGEIKKAIEDISSAMLSVKKQKENLQEVQLLGAHTIKEEIDKYRRIRDDETTSSEMKKGIQQIIEILTANLTATLPSEEGKPTPSAPTKPYEPHEEYQHKYHKEDCPSAGPFDSHEDNYSRGGESQSSTMSIGDIEENYRLQVFERYRKEGLTLEESWRRWLDKVKKKLAEEKEKEMQRERDRYEANSEWRQAEEEEMQREKDRYKANSEWRQAEEHLEKVKKLEAEIKEMKNLRKNTPTPTPAEVRDKNLAKVVRVKRLYHKKVGRVDRNPVEDNYCYYKYNTTFSDSEEELKSKKPIKEKTKYHKKQNSHKKNIQWLETLAREGTSDIGLKLSVEEIIEKLERRLNNEEEEHQKTWNEIRQKQQSQQNQAQAESTRSQQPPTGENEAPKPGERIRKHPFQVEHWEMPKHIEAIKLEDREGSEDYQDWKEMVKSRGDLKDQVPRFEYILPHFKKGYRTEVQAKIEKSELKGMDYVDRETKMWSEALKDCRKTSPWAASGKEFKPSIDNEYNDLLKANNGSKAFASLKERTPRLPNKGNSTKFEIRNQFKIWRKWSLNEGIPWTSMSHYIYRTEVIGEKLMTHYQQKMAAFPLLRQAIVQLSTYIEDQLCFTADADTDSYEETLAEVIQVHAENLRGPTKSTQYLRAHYPTDVEKLMALHSNYKKMEAIHLGNIPEESASILRDLISHNLIRHILTKAHLKSPIMETYLNVGNTSQADAANWDTRNWQEFTSDVERIFKVNKEQDRQVWKTSKAQEKTLEKKIENLELWQGQISEELKAKKEERKTRKSDRSPTNPTGEERNKEREDRAATKQNPNRKPIMRGRKRKFTMDKHNPNREEICENCAKENRVTPYDTIIKKYRIRKMCLRKGHCLQHGQPDCQKSDKCKERNKTQAIRIAIAKLEEVGCNEKEIEHHMKDDVCLFEDQVCQPDSKGNYQHGYHREDCPAEGHIDEDPRDPSKAESTMGCHSSTEESDDEPPRD